MNYGLKGELIGVIFNSIKINVPYIQSSKHVAGRVILVGDTVETGGVCRHMGILVAALLERFIEEGKLRGKVYYVRGPGHGWAVYETSDGVPIVLDVAQNKIGIQDSKMSYWDGTSYHRYQEAYDEVKRREREFFQEKEGEKTYILEQEKTRSVDSLSSSEDTDIKTEIERTDTTRASGARGPAGDRGVSLNDEKIRMDHAMVASFKKGGIDLTQANQYLQAKDGSQSIKFDLDPAQLAQLQNAPGFVPVIINIKPLGNLQTFLGISNGSQETVG